MKILVLFLLTSLTYFPENYGTNSALRCFVEPKSVKGALKRSTGVFLGEVLQVKNGRNYLEARFRVERSWKGVQTEEVSVLTDGHVESPRYRVGEKYLVFAGIKDGQLFTGICSRTRKLEYAQDDLKQLEKEQRLRKKPSRSS